MTSITEKQLKGVKISSDLSKVVIQFTTEVTSEAGNGTEEESDSDSESHTTKHDHKITGRFKPHDDLVKSMMKLRKHAFELEELEVTPKTISSWTVSEIKIDGDVTMKNSRVVMTLAHTTEKYGKKRVTEFNVGQTTMYPEKDEAQRYHDAEKMTEIIEDIIEEAWMYLNGKTGESTSQYSLFPTEAKLITNFDK